MTAEHALRYHDAGWPPLELPARTKAPPPEGRTGHEGVDMTAVEIAAAGWTGNLGVRVPVDVVGIDVDAYHGGRVTMAELIAKCGPLPKTWLSHSNRGDGSGIAFYRVPVGMSWVAGLAGIEIIQRDHRYAVVWPSIHPDGRPYGWFDQAEAAATTEVPLVEDLPELPWSWIAELSRADATSHTRAVDQTTLAEFIDAHDQADAPSYITTILNHFIERRQGGFARHDTMQHCLIWALECVAAGVAAARPTIKQLAEVWVDAVDGDVRRMELWSDHRTTEYEAMLRHAVGKVAAKSEAELHKIHDDIAGIPFNAPPKEPVIDVDQPSIWINWSTFANRDESAKLWLVEDFWPWGRAMALWATAKEGKSELALWCAACLALGRHPWTGAPIDPVEVAYFDYEMTENDLEDRLGDFNLDPLQLDRLHYALHPPIHALDAEAGGQDIERLVTEIGAQAVIFDTFGRAVAGEEDKADTVRAFYRHTGGRLKRLGIGYIRTDHAGKERSRGQRGSSAKRDDVDIIWSLKRTKAGVLLDCSGSSRLSWVPSTLDIDRVKSSAGSIYYAAQIRVGWPAGTVELVAELDKLGLPDDAGRPTLRTAMMAHNIQASNEVLRAAIRYRKERGQSPRSAKTP